MTIAVTAPEKFAFQDLVCVELAHRFQKVSGATMLVEPTAGEDGSISWPSRNGAITTVEVQVKGASGTATLRDLAAYLAHFPDRCSTECLFERILSDPNRRAVFVISSRCDDQLLPLAHREDDTEFAPRAVPEQTAITFLAALLGTHPTPANRTATKLAAERRATIASLTRLSPATVAEALTRVFVIERETDASVEVRLQRALQEQRIDTHSLRAAIAHFMDIVAKAKRTQTDIVAPIVACINRLAPISVRAPGYIERGDEKDLTWVLNDRRALLLSGQPRTGKTWTAREIASEFQRSGFEVRVGQYVEEADRFLTETTGGERLYLLDDPLGSREPIPSAAGAFGSLQGLIGRIPSNRRLIVAQSKPVLLNTARRGRLEDCKVGGQRWIEILGLDLEQAVTVWDRLAEFHDVPPEIRQRVQSMIKNGDDLRDIGAIAFLAQTYAQLPDNASDADIVRQSRSDALGYIVQLVEKGPAFDDLLRAMAMATTNATGATDSDLSYIIDGGDDRPALVPQFAVRSLATAGPPLPRYATEPSLTREQETALDALERRRVIDEAGGHFTFSHPYMRAGAQALAQGDTRRSRENIRNQAVRAIACLSEQVTLATARNLYWMRSLLPKNEETNVSDAFEIARAGLKSIFPATRDECLRFVTSFAHELPSELADRIPHWAESVTLSLADIDVAHGFGVIHRGYRFLDPEPLPYIRAYLDAIERGDPLDLDLVLSRRLLITLRNNPTALSAKAFSRFLAADHAVIRAEAARIWFQVPRESDDEAVRRLMNDSAPPVAVALLKQLGRNWASLTDPRRRALLGILRHQAKSPAIASVLFVRLVVLDRVEHFGENPPYELLSSLMPDVLRSLPRSVSFIDGRFANVVEEAIDSGCREELLPLLQLWASTIVERLGYSQLSEFDLAIIDSLVGALSADTRHPIIEQLLSVDDTGALMVFISWLIYYWDALADVERTTVALKLQEDRQDIQWLRSVVLTSRRSPPILLEPILGRRDLDVSTSSLQELVSPDQFDAAFYTYIGWPQPLWWYGTHHRDVPFWARAVEEIASDPEHRLFEVALAEIMRDPDEKLLATIAILPDSALDRVFDLLLKLTIGTETYVRDAWAALLERGSPRKIDGWAEKILPVLQGFKDLREVVETYGKTELTDKLLNHLAADVDVFRRMAGLSDMLDVFNQVAADDGSLSEEKLELVRRILANQIWEECRRLGPTLHGTWGSLRDKLNELGAEESTINSAEDERRAAVKLHFSIKHAISSFPPEPELVGWRDFQSRVTKLG
ncbi:hypothetical protein GOD78_29785 [Sinorhizobium medicae]|nr:hypothetical protein [Sinorhizobium medicae]MDX0821573.1 hypothetical protein [Sinorhizobium medicae]MDX0864597.1 hypothetical protein [Sinorhizobium medicae]